MSGAAGADEVRMVGVRETVRAFAGRGEHRALLEREDDVARAGRREDVADRVRPLRVRDGVTAAVVDGEVRTLLGRDSSRERRTGNAGASHFQVWVARAAQR